MSAEALAYLKAISETLQRIEIALTSTPKSKRPKSRNMNSHAQLIAEARERDADQTPINRTRVLWLEICPGNPQPQGFTLERKQKVRAFWDAMGGSEEGVRALFELVAGNDWLSGRPVGSGKNIRQRHAPVHLFEVMEHRLEIVEMIYR